MCDRWLCKQEHNGHSSDALEALLVRVMLDVNTIKSTNRDYSSVNKKDGMSWVGRLCLTASNERQADQPHFSPKSIGLSSHAAKRSLNVMFMAASACA